MGPYVPPGQSPPFEVVDDFHHGAFIIITAALGLVVSLACFLIRLYVRLILIPPFARDDMVLLGATAVGVVQSILVFYACSRGFGTSISLLDITRVNQIQAVSSRFACFTIAPRLSSQIIATSDVFALVVIYLSKCCVVAIYLRLTPQKPHNRASWATFALCTVWLIPAVFILLVNCELNKPWRTEGGQCQHLVGVALVTAPVCGVGTSEECLWRVLTRKPFKYERWQFIATVDILTELILFLLAVALLKGLFMSVKRKLGIGFAFLFRFPLIVFTLLHISTLRSALHDPDVTLAAVEPTLWLQVEVHYALVACSVFCLRPFMAAVSTNYGTAGDSNLESSTSASRSRDTKGSSKSGSGSGSNSASRSRSLSRVQRKRAGTASRAEPEMGAPRSSSQERLCRDVDGRGSWSDGVRERERDAQQQQRKRESETRGAPARAPVRRSLFPLSASSKAAAKPDKRTGSIRGSGLTSARQASDLIELVPQLHRPYGRQEPSDTREDEDLDQMVIRKEVGYSIQYEYDEARRKGLGSSKKGSTDAVVYV
ncbi:uncharacterized protein N7459_004031 [Penicillium hispanicum]|uniref:uncharacterized protein n=1 Tax=Penicillium hispanicum TaxID=1080232 RepID=UPI00253F9D84|nr:uncharacterized protein N7459_004031 [Penicillium hispanicum]KAJ5584231.1 hypothetical protein N7459_004031 [Penicillium hispanicum]